MKLQTFILRLLKFSRSPSQYSVKKFLLQGSERKLLPVQLRKRDQPASPEHRVHPERRHPLRLPRRVRPGHLRRQHPQHRPARRLRQDGRADHGGLPGWNRPATGHLRQPSKTVHSTMAMHSTTLAEPICIPVLPVTLRIAHLPTIRRNMDPEFME